MVQKNGISGQKTDLKMRLQAAARKADAIQVTVSRAREVVVLLYSGLVRVLLCHLVRSKFSATI